MTGAVADTHALIWYLEDSPHLGTAARETFDWGVVDPFHHAPRVTTPVLMVIGTVRASPGTGQPRSVRG